MDKKNTMLLTVIAVATLLVAVVGATFAYFSIVQQPEGGSTSATKFQGTTEGVDEATFGTASLTDHEDEFYIALTAADMSQMNAGDSGKDYYATTTPNSGVSTSNKETDVANAYHKIATAVIKGGTEGKKFRCTSTVKIAAGEGENTMADLAKTMDTQMQAKDGSIKFQNEADGNGNNHVYFYKSTETIANKADSVEFDLLSVLKAEAGTTFHVVYDITTANVEEVKGEAAFEAALKIVNRNAPQNYLADKKLSLKVDNTEFVCSNVESFD